MKKVVIAGGTGFIGSYLTTRFQESGYQVFIVSRSSEHLQWDHIELSQIFEGAQLVINLAGKSINCRHNETNKKIIINSRLNTTQLIGYAINDCSNPPELWINASAAGIYKPSIDKLMTEDESELGNDFLAEVVRQWESEFFGFKLPETRQVALRTSVVLGQHGGALKPLILLTRLGLGGKQGDGKQLFSWIHIEDYFRIILFLIENPTLRNVINCTSPASVSNEQFMFTLRKKLHVNMGIPAPKQAIQLGSKLIGVESEFILNSSNVVPKRLLEAGFLFNYPTLDLALTDLFQSKSSLLR